MKKGLCILLVFAVIFCLAACGKNGNKGEIYTPPYTEVITFEDGETAIYEVMTDAEGEPVTDSEGITELVPYDPPVTEDGGYLVTTPEGETIKQSQTTAAQSVEVDYDIIDLETTVPSANETTAKTDATTSKEETTTIPAETTAKADGGALQTPDTGNEPTTLKEIPEGETYALSGTLSKEDAQKLVGILNIPNPFDEALASGDFYLAEEKLPDYLASIENAVRRIKEDKKLYKYVGNQNLQMWYDYMVEAADRYAVFMGVVRGTEGEKPGKAFFATYEDFQNYYRFSLQVYYHMQNGAERIMYS
ncbi:MAG: hypothetical protein IJN81_05500 [Clostridia bacterium]|nr:hypothetical protein [Clostridia bacterium]